MWTPPQTLPDRLFGPIAIDSEGKDPDLKERGPGWAFSDPSNGPVGYSVRADNWKGYLPFGHEDGGNMDPDLVHRWLQHQLNIIKQEDLPLIFANGTYDVGWMMKKGFIMPDHWHDILVIDENQGRRGYNLDAVADRFCGIRKDESGLEAEGARRGLKPKEIKANMWRFHSSHVGVYAEQDAEATYQVFMKARQQMDEQDLWDIYSLEMQIQPVLLAMRFRGVRVDLKLAEQYIEEFEKREKDHLAEVKRLTGVEVRITAASSKALALRAQGHEPPKTEKTGKDSITQEYLEDLIKVSNDPVAAHLLEAGKLRKAREDFIISNIMEKHEKGRIHATFNQLMSDSGGTVGGRMSGVKPNLQNQYNPEKEKELGTKIRRLWLPEEGELWAAEDYSSQEPRLTVHYAYVTDQRGADVAVQRYQDNPRTDYHQMVADLAGITRKQAKPINLGLAYGMGEPKLCHILGLPTEWVEKEWYGKKRLVEVAGPEGAELLRSYHEGVPYLRGLMKQATNTAKDRGYIRTLLGRRCRFPVGPDGKRWYCHKALNRLIQGSAADQTKKAMIDVHKAGFKILVQVHDELGVSVANEKEAREVKHIMENCVKLSVPSIVDIGLGPTWGDCVDLKD